MAAEPHVATEGAITSNDGTRLAYRVWPVAGASVTFAVVHGLGDHSGRYERFANGMAAYQMATYAIDLRGHGKSEGARGHIDAWTQWVDDAASFVKHVESQVDGEVVPLGHSFGGAIMLSTVRASKLSNAKRFVVSSPALKVKVKVPGWKVVLASLTAKVAPRIALDNEVDPKTISRIPEIVEAYRTDPLVHSKISSRTYAEWMQAARENLEHADEIKIPFMIVAGTDDPLVDPRGSEELHRKAPEMSELHIFAGRYHEPFNDLGSDEVFAAIADWLRR